MEGMTAMASMERQAAIDIDRRTFSFYIETPERLRRGDTVIVRDVLEIDGRLQVRAATEDALRYVATRLLVD
jgi:hypothetical protein